MRKLADSDSGKVSPELFEQSILPYLGAKDQAVIIAPSPGIDFGLISAGSGRVVAVATDPLFVLPELGWERATWFALHIIASDVALSGIAPQFMSISLNLPLDFADSELSALWQGMHEAAKGAGIAIITGHTGRYEGCSFPTIGSATVFGLGREDYYVTTAMAQPGDQILMTNWAALESTALISLLCPSYVSQLAGAAGQLEGAEMFARLSCVSDAAALVSIGLRKNGITSMHDATERGIAGALVEIASAAAVGLAVDADLIPVHPTTRALFDQAGADPLTASSAGTLLFTCTQSSLDQVIRTCAISGIKVTRIGEIRTRTDGCKMHRSGQLEPLNMPASDPFWPMLTAFRRREQGEA